MVQEVMVYADSQEHAESLAIRHRDEGPAAGVIVFAEPAIGRKASWYTGREVPIGSEGDTVDEIIKNGGSDD